MKMNKLFSFFSLGTLLILSLFIGIAANNPENPSGLVTAEKSKFQTTWCPSIIRADGEYEEWDCWTENVVFNDGFDALAEDIVGFSDFNMTLLYLCNGTDGGVCDVQTADQTAGFNVYTSCGLGKKNASSVTDPPGTGNFTVFASWTSTCDGRIVNATKLGDELSGRNISGTEFTQRTLNNGDEFRLNATGQHQA